MHDFISKTATDECTAGLLKIMDDIASLRAAPAPPTAVDGDRVLSMRSGRPRATRAATIAPGGKTLRLRGFLPALFAGGVGFAVLAGPATCSTCHRVHADVRINAERIAAPISTAAISSASDRVPGNPPALSLPKTIEELTDRGPPSPEIVATLEGVGESETPLPPVSDTMVPSKDVTGVEHEKPAPRSSAVQRQFPIRQVRTRARTPAMHNATPSSVKLYSANKYARAPGWAAKMFETNWQGTAFAYQYETH